MVSLWSRKQRSFGKGHVIQLGDWSRHRHLFGKTRKRNQHLLGKRLGQSVQTQRLSIPASWRKCQ
jgi:hypothetical protein